MGTLERGRVTRLRSGMGTLERGRVTRLRSGMGTLWRGAGSPFYNQPGLPCTRPRPPVLLTGRVTRKQRPGSPKGQGHPLTFAARVTQGAGSPVRTRPGSPQGAGSPFDLRSQGHPSGLWPMANHCWRVGSGWCLGKRNRGSSPDALAALRDRRLSSCRLPRRRREVLGRATLPQGARDAAREEKSTSAPKSAPRTCCSGKGTAARKMPSRQASEGSQEAGSRSQSSSWVPEGSQIAARAFTPPRRAASTPALGA